MVTRRQHCKNLEAAPKRSREQLARLNRNGWNLSAWDADAGGICAAGTDNHGDRVRGHIDPQGNFNGEPADADD